MSIRDKVAFVLIIGLTVSIPLIIKSFNSGSFVGVRQRFSERTSDIQKRLAVLKKNLDDEFSPQIQRPLSTYSAEDKLVTYFPETFANFTRSDWNKFWNFIYSTHVTDDYGKDFYPKRKRQLTKEELQGALSKEYPMPFSYFRIEHWQEFWQDIVKYE